MEYFQRFTGHAGNYRGSSHERLVSFFVVIIPRIGCKGWLPWHLHRHFSGSTDNRSGQTSVPFSSAVVTWLRAGFLLTFVLPDRLRAEFNTINLQLELLTVRTLEAGKRWQQLPAPICFPIYGNMAQISGPIALSV